MTAHTKTGKKQSNDFFVRILSYIFAVITTTMRRIGFLILLTFLSNLLYSQGTLKGKITDSTAKNKPLGLATVSVFKASDTTLLSYRLSNPEGEFKVPGLPLDLNCRVVISYSGYSVYRKEFTMTAAQTTVDLGTINMSPDAKSLDEVLVFAERPPVVIKKDTIEFNASAFKTLPNALVEDLLKKLPGVQVDRDGNIMVNGKPVNRILVDGKTFFGDDPKMATRNLPANVIDKVQVTDDKEEMLRNGDDNPNNVGKVVNLTLKKGVKKGWFGKAYAGAGSTERFETGFIANIYRDTLQLSVLAYANNINRAGFSYSELQSAGGFDRVRSNSNSNNTSVWNSNSGSGVSINGINFGGMQNFGGISTSLGAGFNLNHAPNKKRSMYLQYFNGNVRAPRVTTTDLDQFVSDTVINTFTRLTGDMVTHGHSIGAGLRLKPDSVTNLLVNLSYLIGIQFEDRNSLINGHNSKIGPLSNGDIIQNNDGDLYIYRHNINLTRLSKTKKGRRFNFFQTLDINNRYNDYMSESDLHYFYPTTYDSIYAQLRKERIPRTDAVTSFNYSEPLDKHFTVRIGGRHEYGRLNNGVSTYNRVAGNEKFEIFNALLSSDFRRISHRFFVNPGLEYKWKDITITPSIRFLDQRVNNNLLSSSTILKQKQFDVLPGISFVWKQLSLNYSKDVNLPGFNHLNPVTDISNPYFVVKGNPGLLPTRRNSISANYNFNDAKRYINAGGWANANFSDNDIVQSITIDNRGVQTSMPVNANKTRNYGMNVNVNKQYKTKQNVMFSWNTGNWMNYTKSQLFFNNIASWQTTFNYNHWFGAGMNLKDIFEWNLSYSFGKNFTRYTSDQFKKLNVSSYNMGTDMVLRWPKHLVWETQISYTYNGSIPAGLPKNGISWNGALNFTMFKDETGVLKLGVNDILNRNTSINVNANRNSITTTHNNILARYFMATFTYNVRAAGVKKRIGGRERFFLF